MCRVHQWQSCDSIFHYWIFISHLWLGQHKFLFSHWPRLHVEDVLKSVYYRPFHAANCLSYFLHLDTWNRVLYGIIIRKPLPCGIAWERLSGHDDVYTFLSVIDFWLLSYRHSFPHVYKILQRDNCQNTLWTNYIENLSTGRYNKYRNCANIFEQSLTISSAVSIILFLIYLFIFF